MSKELDLFLALKEEQERLCDRFGAMTETLAKILPELTTEEDARYDDLLNRFAHFGKRSLTAQVDFDRLCKEATTQEEQLQALARAAGAFERDIEELNGFIREAQEIVNAHRPNTGNKIRRILQRCMNKLRGLLNYLKK